MGTPTGLEAKLVPAAGIEFVALNAAGFDRAKPWTLVTSGIEVATSSLKARTILKNFGAEVAVGFGGYVSIPVGLAATQLSIPLVIHEQNSVAGMTNNFLARHARAICLTYPDTVPAMKDRARSDALIKVTGNPVRSMVLSAKRGPAREALGLGEEDIFVFVFGGSRGARHINTVLVGMLERVLQNPHVKIVHATGEKEYDTINEATKNLNADGRYTASPYIENMGEMMAATDIALCRAGATSIAELTALGIASILVPYPYATDDHQTKNARAMVNHKAAVLIADDQLDERMETELVSLIENKGRRILMAQASLELGQRNSAQMLVDSIYSVVEKK